MNKPRVPMCEDVLVRANEYCRWSGMRFGQLIVNAIIERLVEANADSEARCNAHSLVKETIFYIENEGMEAALMAFVTKHTARHEAINRMAQEAVALGLYDLTGPPAVDPIQPGE